jgi:hypothetical protein
MTIVVATATYVAVVAVFVGTSTRAASIFANRLAVHVPLRHLLQENYFQNLRVARVVVDLKTELGVAIYGIVEQDRKYKESYYNCYYRILVERITFWHIYTPASFNDYTGWE